MKELPQDPQTSSTDARENNSAVNQDSRPAADVPPDGREGLPMPSSGNSIFGVDRLMLESFLSLIHDYYDKVDKATAFLEMRMGEINISGIRNVRGVLSHFVIFLDPASPSKKRAEQLKNAEGHMRKAIEEPYEIAFDGLTVSFQRTYEQYKSEVLPIQSEHAFLHSAPNRVMVDARLREIGELATQGRAAKEKDLRDPEWETGINCFVDAFEKLFALKAEIEVHYSAYSTMKEEEIRQENLRKQLRDEIHDDLARESKRMTVLHYFGIAIGIIGIVVAVLLVIFPRFADWIRTVLHLE